MSVDPEKQEWFNERTSFNDASEYARSWLDLPKPDPDATDEYAMCFHTRWMRILLLDVALFDDVVPTPVVLTYEGAASVLGCPVEIVPELLDRLRRDEEQPPLTERDFSRSAQSN